MLMKYLEEYIFDGLGQRFQVFLSHYTVHRLAVHIPCWFFCSITTYAF